MTKTREEYIEHQRCYTDRAFGLTKGEEAPKAEFERLAADTIDALIAIGKKPIAPFYIRPDSGFCPACRYYWDPSKMPRKIVERWRRWRTTYHTMLARNPKLKLRDLLQDISESNDASSFPYGYEDLVWLWVSSGDMAAPPFSDRHDVVEAEFFRHLRELMAALNGGWLVWSDTATSIVYVDRDAWLGIVAKRATERAEFRRQTDERIARDPAFAATVAEAKRRAGKS